MNGANRVVAAGLFQQEWWLRASGGDDLRCASVLWDGKAVASVYFVCLRAFGFKLLRQPPYTRTHGPILQLPPSSAATYSRNLRRAVQELVDELPPHERFELLLDPDDPCVLPFALAGCSVEQEFTFRLPALTGVEAQRSLLDPKTRNLIKSASQRLHVLQAIDFEAFLELSARELAGESRQNLRALRAIAAAALRRGQLMVLSAHDDADHAVAMVVLVWDAEMLFLWQSARDPARPVPGANSLLVWEAMQFAIARGLNFDMDGYHSRSAALFAMKFGLVPVARPTVIHMTPWGAFAKNVALALGRRPGRGQKVQPIR